MSEELEVLKIVTGRLERAGIGYMVTGSMALNYYAMPRMTQDVDRVVDLFRDDFYLDAEAVRRAIEKREAFNAIEMTRVVKADFVVRKESAYRRTEFARKRRVSVDGHGLFIVAPEDLVISKLDWARDTPRELDHGYRTMLLQRSDEARLLMGDSMYAAARALVRASILAATPRISPAQLRQQIFLRFHGHEFDVPTRDKILAALAREA